MACYGCSEKFARAIYRHRLCVIACWTVILIVFTPAAVIVVFYRFIGMSTKPVSGSYSDIALHSLKHHFAELTDVRTEKVELRCMHLCEDSDWHIRAKSYVEMLKSKIDSFEQKHPGSIIKTISFFDMHLAELAGMHRAGMSSMFVSHDKSSVLFTWIWSVPQKLQYDAEYFTQELAEFIEEKINALEVSDHQGRIVVSLTGLVTLSRRVFVSIVQFFIGDLRNSWLNICVLWFALKDLKLTFLALLPMTFEIALGIGLLYFLSFTMDVTYFAALMCLNMLSAMGWDYSLFTLSRYTSERKNGLSVEGALVTALAHSFPLIVISAIVLTISWSVLFFMPEMFQNFAVCAAIGVFAAALANITLLPALLAVFPCLGPQAENPSEKSLQAASRSVSQELDPLTRAEQFMSGCYYKLAKYITRWPINVILIVSVYLLMMPFTIRAFRNFGPSGLILGHSYKLTLPRGSEEWSTALRIQKNFHPMFGVLMPTTLFATIDNGTLPTAHKSLLDYVLPWRRGRDNDELWNQKLFDSNCRMMNNLVEYTADKPYAIKPNSLFGPSMPIPDAEGHVKCFSYAHLDAVTEGRAGKLMAHIGLLHSLKEELSFMWTLMKAEHAILSVVNPSIDPLGPEAFHLMSDMRAILERTDAEDQETIPGIKRMMYGAATYYMDNIKYSEKALPKVFLCCSFLCFLLVAVNFKAVFIPVKLVLTVIWPITWFFGLALMVYEDGLLKDVGIAGLSPTGDDGLDWTVPMFSVTFMIGVALDYDYFLFERIYEFRASGFGNRESIQLGLSAQAVTITAGGLILSFTFFSMITESAMPVTNQLGFMYFAGILIDTFLVRTIVTPALLSIGSWMNYWPIEMPEPIYEWLDANIDPLEDLQEQDSQESESDDSQAGSDLRLHTQC